MRRPVRMMAGMSTDDAAFLWETEAIRQRRQVQARGAMPPSPGWVTLRQAHRSTGVPIDTLRKWGKRGAVPSMVIDADDGLRRLVRLESVVERARAQGRTLLAGMGNGGAQPEPPSPSGASTAEAASTGASPSVSAALDSASTDEPRAGTMLVPIEAWDKMLMQLGNLHDAGQQLAAARERAAKAETEARFLRERLAELRETQAAESQQTPPRPADPRAANDELPVSDPVPRQHESIWDYALRRWRSRHSR